MIRKSGFFLLVVPLVAFLLMVPADTGHAKSRFSKVANRSSLSEQAGGNPRDLVLRSSAAIVEDQKTGELLIQKHANAVVPIASITKLMTAMVVLDSDNGLDKMIMIQSADRDLVRHSRSRLPVGARLTRADALLIALMASDNRAASALGHAYPGGSDACVAAMNAKARSLGLYETHFQDTTGLSSGNVSSARDLVRLVDAAYQYGLIREYTTCKHAAIFTGRRVMQFHNTNRLIQNPRWEIGLSKTGYIDEAGRCLVMQAQVAQRPVLIVLLDSQGKLTRVGDANRIRKWLEGASVSPQTRKG